MSMQSRAAVISPFNTITGWIKQCPVTDTTRPTLLKMAEGLLQIGREEFNMSMYAGLRGSDPIVQDTIIAQRLRLYHDCVIKGWSSDTSVDWPVHYTYAVTLQRKKHEDNQAKLTETGEYLAEL